MSREEIDKFKNSLRLTRKEGTKKKFQAGIKAILPVPFIFWTLFLMPLIKFNPIILAPIWIILTMSNVMFMGVITKYHIDNYQKVSNYYKEKEVLLEKRIEYEEEISNKAYIKQEKETSSYKMVSEYNKTQTKIDTNEIKKEDENSCNL